MSITVDSTQREAPRPRGPTSFRLVVTSEQGRGRELLVHESSPGPLRIGSSRACDLVLADRKVSRRHLAVECVGGRLRLTDLRSTNGTTVNGVAVELAFLGGGETIRVGDVLLTVDAVDARSSATAPPMASVQTFGRILGASLAMRRLYPLFERLAASSLSVLIEGETGTGKELLAETLHEQSARRGGPFVVVDVEAFDEQQLEQVLFGGAAGGAFEDAHQGTLFIDDIAEVPLAIQNRLVRAFDRGEVVRAGGASPIKVDVRLLLGTRRNLDREVEDGNFREDLFHRLAASAVELPPLRAREGDAALLIRHFWRELDRTGAAPPEDLQARVNHEWPGNVRELKNLVTRRFVLGTPLSDVEQRLATPGRREAVLESIVEKDLAFAEARERAIAAFERLYITRMLERHGGNVSRAAAISGLARRYFHRLKARHLK